MRIITELLDMQKALLTDFTTTMKSNSSPILGYDSTMAGTIQLTRVCVPTPSTPPA